MFKWLERVDIDQSGRNAPYLNIIYPLDNFIYTFDQFDQFDLFDKFLVTFMVFEQ